MQAGVSDRTAYPSAASESVNSEMSSLFMQFTIKSAGISLNSSMLLTTVTLNFFDISFARSLFRMQIQDTEKYSGTNVAILK